MWMRPRFETTRHEDWKQISISFCAVPPKLSKVTGDAKIWYNSLDPGCVQSPQDMIYYFSAKYFPPHKKQAASREIYNFVQIEEEIIPQAWGRLL